MVCIRFGRKMGFTPSGSCTGSAPLCTKKGRMQGVDSLPKSDKGVSLVCKTHGIEDMGYQTIFCTGQAVEIPTGGGDIGMA